MAKRICTFLLTVTLCFSVYFGAPGAVFAKDKVPTPEEIVAAHIKSIGSPEALAGIRNRGVSGNSGVQFLIGGTGKLAGQSMLVSAGPFLGLILKYGGLEYPGEYFAYDGNEVTVSNISPGQRSPLADFIYRHGGVVKEGLLTGALSLGWPLLDFQKNKPTLRVSDAKIEGRELYEVEYIPKRDIGEMKVKLYFDPATFHHVRTEYRLRVRGEQSLQAGQTVTRGGASPITRDAGVQESMSDSIYSLTERFDNFKPVQLKEAKGGVRTLTLPHSYNIEYSIQGAGSSFQANWSIELTQWIQNGQIDSSIFKVH